MENIVNVLEYNTHREKMTLPEYGRNIQKMVEHIKTIEDRTKRSEQARAIIRSMEILNPSIHTQENWEHTLWDQLYVMADYDLDIDSPYPVPQRAVIEGRPNVVPVQKTPVKARHYGRNIESIIELIASEGESDVKRQMIHDLAVYMRTQYLIWNKDSVNDQTIFQDIELLSGGRIKVPEDMVLTELSKQANFSRPSMGNLNPGGHNRGGNRGRNRKPNRK